MVSNQIFTPVHQEVRTTFLLREEALVYCEQDRQVVRSAEHPLADKKKLTQTKKKKKRLSITVRLMDVRINALFLNHCLFTIYSNIQPLPKPQYLYILHRDTIKRLVISF